MKRTSIATYAAAAALLFSLAAGTAGAQDNSSTGAPAGPNGPNQADQQFVTQAIKANDQEIDQARAELNSTNDPNVKMFAQRMINDHTAANAQIAAIARQLNMQYPQSHVATENGNSMEHSGTPPPAANNAPAASAMPPAQYMQQEVQDHQKAIGLFEGEARNGGSSQLRTTAAELLPQLRAHLAMAQQYTNTGRITPVSTPTPPANGQPPR